MTAYNKLKEAGVKVLSEPIEVPVATPAQNPVRKSLFYFNDPDGVLLEIAEYKEL